MSTTMPNIRAPYLGISCENPAVRYQTQKQIQHCVRVSASAYTGVLADVSASTGGKLTSVDCYDGTVWNQASDRLLPHVGVGTVPTRGSSTRSTITRCQPGVTAGGKGCDVKHGSYDRYLLRLKGLRNVRAGPTPKDYAIPIAPNATGGKVFKAGMLTNYAPNTRGAFIC